MAITGSEQVEIDAGGHAVHVNSRARRRFPATTWCWTLDYQVAGRGWKNSTATGGGGAPGRDRPQDPAACSRLVSMPGFDPKTCSSTAIDPQNWDLLNNSIDRPDDQPRALNGTYPPGSHLQAVIWRWRRWKLGKSAIRSNPFSIRATSISATIAFRDDKTRRTRHRGHVQVHRAVVRYLLLHPRQRPRHRQYFNLHGRVRIRQPAPASTSTANPKACLPSQKNGKKSARFKKTGTAEMVRRVKPSASASARVYNSYTPLQLAQAMATLRQRRRHVSAPPRGELHRGCEKPANARRSSRKPVRTIKLKRRISRSSSHAMQGRDEGRHRLRARVLPVLPIPQPARPATAQVIELKANEKVCRRQRQGAGIATTRCSSHLRPVEDPKNRFSRCWWKNGGFRRKRRRRPIARAVARLLFCSANCRRVQRLTAKIPRVVD